MSTLLIRNIHTLITLKADRQPISGGAIFARGTLPGTTYGPFFRITIF